MEEAIDVENAIKVSARIRPLLSKE